MIRLFARTLEQTHCGLEAMNEAVKRRAER
jgi:hypothetical protein